MKSSLLLAFCFLFICTVDQTEMCLSSISPLGMFQGIICNIERLKRGNLEPELPGQHKLDWGGRGGFKSSDSELGSLFILWFFYKNILCSIFLKFILVFSLFKKFEFACSLEERESSPSCYPKVTKKMPFCIHTACMRYLSKICPARPQDPSFCKKKRLLFL